MINQRPSHHVTAGHLPAILWVLLSTFLWTVIFAAGKLSGGEIGAFQITFLRYVGGFSLLSGAVVAQGRLAQHRSARPSAHFARAVCGCGAAVAITWASTRMPLVDATAIGMLSGVLTVLLGVAVLNERLGRANGIAIFLAVVGVAFVMLGKGAFRSGLFLIPALVAFLSAAMFALEGLLISVLGRAERPGTVMLHVSFFGLVLMGGPAWLEWRPLSWQATLSCISLGPVGLIAQYCTIRGYRAAPLSVVAPIDYSWILFSALLGAMFFGEIPGPSAWIGCTLIVSGGVVLARAHQSS
ncbi:hypothetical protein OCH239_09340 [Roseivivax halodurans JCM 10272]|uniref:EamA domain-containing protein n=1 Tax=Roseivivax halodurans JCM 10272 TaxID=1449350 RepID=X7EEU9_9RHOB|nr:DMT family transporter [Roseivivax halodurans]ETX13658.1 hypothetical protein OCH239_09340 [Roseivivax halodurans JCM 10272]